MANDMTFGKWDWVSQPLNILCSFALKGALKSWYERQYATPGVKTILDSGAFSAWKSGTRVLYDDYITEVVENIEWDEIVSLDVIGNAQASFDNAIRMRDAGVKVLPVFHYGSPWEMLQEYKTGFSNRVALGGITSIGTQQKTKWLEQCFARAYPCKFHGFGLASEDLLMALPFASADSAAWSTVHMFGRSQAAPGLAMPKLGNGDRTEHYDLRFEIKHYLELEAKVKDRWSQELSWVNAL